MTDLIKIQNNTYSDEKGNRKQKINMIDTNDKLSDKNDLKTAIIHNYNKKDILTGLKQEVKKLNNEGNIDSSFNEIDMIKEIQNVNDDNDLKNDNKTDELIKDLFINGGDTDDYKMSDDGKNNDNNTNNTNNNDDDDNDGDDDDNEMNDDTIDIGPTSERWQPLGADNEETTSMLDNVFLPSSLVSSNNSASNVIKSSSYYNLHTNDPSSTVRIKSLEEEQEVLTTSLIALTSHFAQVQFRLRQIVEAPSCDRDQLLKNLEEFAFRGIPEITGNLTPNESEEVISNLERARHRQFELIDRLKRQLTELEKFAYDSGAPVLPQSILIEKQKILIDELKNKLNLNVNDIDLPQLTTEDLRNHVDTAIGEFVGPLKMKEQLVAQLKTQITDLERFIAFLQGETTIQQTTNLNEQNGTIDAYNSYAAKKKHISNTVASSLSTSNCMTSSSRTTSSTLPSSKGLENSKFSNFERKSSTVTDRNNSKKFEHNNSFNNHQHNSKSLTQPPQSSSSPPNNDATYSIGSFSKAHNLLDKAATLLQMFAVAQFGCGSNRFQKNTLKKTTKYNHWGDLRAQLEVDIQEILSLVITRDQNSSISPVNNNKIINNSNNRCNASKKIIKNYESKNLSANKRIFNECDNVSDLDDDDDDDDDDYDQDEEDTSGSSSSYSSSDVKNVHNIVKLKSKSNQHKHNQQLLNDQSDLSSSSSISLSNKTTTTKNVNNTMLSKSSTLSSTISVSNLNLDLATVVRKKFSVTLQKLIQHGLRIENDAATNLVPFMGCLNPTTLRETTLSSSSSSSGLASGPYNMFGSSSGKGSGFFNNYYCDNTYDDDYYNDLSNGGSNRQLHAWELILEYYNIKNGEQYNDTPARKLSQSFNLDIVGGTAISNKQSLLSAIGSIIAMHSPYKRSYNSHFKAFVCAGLNSHKLVQWLNLIFQCNELIETYYTNWSYVAKTGFRDSLKSIDRLTKYDFDLPVDLAIRQFQNIKDVFM